MVARRLLHTENLLERHGVILLGLDIRAVEIRDLESSAPKCQVQRVAPILIGIPENFAADIYLIR